MRLVRLHSLRSQIVKLSDGEHPRISAAWYDDEDWVIRYVSVVDGGETYLVPSPLLEVDEHNRPRVREGTPRLFRQDKQNRASAAGDRIVPTEMTRAEERAVLGRYGLPTYWGGSGLWGDAFCPSELGEARRERRWSSVLVHQDEVRVFSADDILQETVACPDGAYGSVVDFLIDLDSWSVRYLIVRALPGFNRHEEALVSPFWGQWDRASDQLRLPFTRTIIRASPAYKPDALTPKDEQILARYYGFVRNW